MEKEKIYITVNHLDDYLGSEALNIGDELTLKKDVDNCFDCEAILVYGPRETKCGYVANSVATVARGTYSAGRLYDKMADGRKCTVVFILDDCLIAEVE